WASGSSNNPQFMHSVDDVIAGMDVLTREPKPRLVVCWINNARNSLPGLVARGRVGHLPKMGDDPCVVENPKNFS
ncbi:MAG: hypothetical protein L0287_16735, partial [Anaerolineae bacterium]|nr:hypothetical protein [Anaerolineae bacterium]